MESGDTTVEAGANRYLQVPRDGLRAHRCDGDDRGHQELLLAVTATTFDLSSLQTTLVAPNIHRFPRAAIAG